MSRATRWKSSSVMPLIGTGCRSFGVGTAGEGAAPPASFGASNKTCGMPARPTKARPAAPAEAYEMPSASDAASTGVASTTAKMSASRAAKRKRGLRMGVGTDRRLVRRCRAHVRARALSVASIRRAVSGSISAGAVGPASVRWAGGASSGARSEEGAGSSPAAGEAAARSMGEPSRWQSERLRPE